MIRTDIITTVGRKYLTSNIENEEFSYGKALKSIGKDYTNFLSQDAKRAYKDLDIRFANDKLSILIETKQNLSGKDLNDGVIQVRIKRKFMLGTILLKELQLRIIRKQRRS